MTAAPNAPQADAPMTATLVVGMEVHVELATRSKMWTDAPNLAHEEFQDAEPNTLLDGVVIGMPGTLPVMNRVALEMSIRVGLALGCRIARYSKWDRKSYHYPDLPKNYQISQYDLPICGEGSLEFPVPRPDDAGQSYLKTVRIRRAHLEEDAGKLLHEAPGGHAIDHSIIDLNRAGTPLLEIVTEPDLHSADEAVAFAQALRNLCRSLGVTQGVMQRGHIRFEPNINVVLRRGDREFRTPIVEVKNLNSFRAVHGAITHEYQRQVEDFLRTGRTMTGGDKSTRGWDDVRMVTLLQREKEEAHEYRYFPDPDLVPVVVDEPWLDRLAATIPELPLRREARYVQGLGLSPKDARQLLDEPRVADYFDAVLARGRESASAWDARAACKLLLNNAAKLANERGVTIDRLGVAAEQVAGLLTLLAQDKVGSAATDKLLAAACVSAEPVDRLAQQMGLLQVSDTGALEALVTQALADPRNAKAIEELRAGKDKALGSIMGQIMKLSAGKANPKLLTEMILARVRG